MKNHPLDDLTSSDFIYQVLRVLVAAAVFSLIAYQATPLILELLHEAYNGILIWLHVFMDYTRTVN